VDCAISLPPARPVAHQSWRNSVRTITAMRPGGNDHGGTARLGGVSAVLGTVEHERGHPDVALNLERDTLRLKYEASVGPADTAASHHNYGNYVTDKPLIAPAHHIPPAFPGR